MLSAYERRVLSEMEASLRLMRAERGIRRVVRLAGLPVSAALLVTTLCLAGAAVLPAVAAAALTAVSGIATGWQLRPALHAGRVRLAARRARRPQRPPRRMRHRGR